MQVHSSDILKLCCRGLCGPWHWQGGQFGWGLKRENALAKIYFWLSINYSSDFPILLSLSDVATPALLSVVVKCDGGTYDLDVLPWMVSV